MYFPVPPREEPPPAEPDGAAPPQDSMQRAWVVRVGKILLGIALATAAIAWLSSRLTPHMDGRADASFGRLYLVFLVAPALFIAGGSYVLIRAALLPNEGAEPPSAGRRGWRRIAVGAVAELGEMIVVGAAAIALLAYLKR